MAAVSPVELMKKLHRLPVSIDNRPAPVVIRIRHYCSGNSSVDARAPEHHQYSHRLVSACGHDRLGLSRSDLARTALGLGLPGHIAIALQLAERHRIYSHVAGAAENLPANLTARVQRLADLYFGLDCVGFVSAWARENNLPVSRVDSRTPREFLTPGSFDHRSSLQAVRANDFLVWANDHHIAMIADTSSGVNSSGVLPILIAEAAGTPIQCRDGRLRLAAHPTTVHSRRFGTLTTPFELAGETPVAVFVGGFSGLP